jgi:hypothetical protein
MESYAVWIIATLGAAAVIARCAWSRLWAHLAVVILYLVAVVGAVRAIEHRSATNPYLNGKKPDVSYVARRALPKNRRLTEADFEEPANLPLGYFWYLPPPEQLKGRYLPGDVAATGDIDAAGLLVAPVVSPHARLLAIETPELKQVMNAGATVALCVAEHECMPGSIRVEAIVCAPETPPQTVPQVPCWVALPPLTTDQEKAIAAAKSTASRYKMIVTITLP